LPYDEVIGHIVDSGKLVLMKFKVAEQGMGEEWGEEGEGEEGELADEEEEGESEEDEEEDGSDEEMLGGDFAIDAGSAVAAVERREGNEQTAEGGQAACVGGVEGGEAASSEVEGAVPGVATKKKKKKKRKKAAVETAPEVFVTLYTASTHSTSRMEGEERRLKSLLAAHKVMYELVHLDLQPGRWPAVEAISKTKNLPQLFTKGTRAAANADGNGADGAGGAGGARGGVAEEEVEEVVDLFVGLFDEVQEMEGMGAE
jgi:hypothetical protein